MYSVFLSSLCEGLKPLRARIYDDAGTKINVYVDEQVNLRNTSNIDHAYKSIRDGTEEAKEFGKMFDGIEKKYLTKCFEPAREVSKAYISTAQKFFNSRQISQDQREEFLNQIPDADLTSPLMVL